MWVLWPISTPGRPGTLTPVTDRPGADRATWYQMEGTVCGRCGSPASIDFAPATLGPLAAQALLLGNSWIRPGGSALAWASMAAAAIAVRADTRLVLEPGPDTGASARWRSSAVVTAVVPETREEDGSAGDATRAAGPGTGPFAAAGLAAPGAGSLAVAGLASAVCATGTFAAAAAGAPAAAGLAAAVVGAGPAGGGRGARPGDLWGRES